MKSIQIILVGMCFLFACNSRKKYQDNNGANPSSISNSTYSSALQNDEDEDERFPDDTYCAEVEYYNPNTGTHSSYTLTVEVESNEVTKIYFPNGGWLDNDHFLTAELDEDGTVSFTSDKGYEYNVTIIGSDHDCFTENVPMAVQCKGETEEGDQCENMTDKSDGLCWQHEE